MHCGLPGSSVHGISQARILELVAISFSRGSSPSKDQTHASCIGRRILYTESPGKPNSCSRSSHFLCRGPLLLPCSIVFLGLLCHFSHFLGLIASTSLMLIITSMLMTLRSVTQFSISLLVFPRSRYSTE